MATIQDLITLISRMEGWGIANSVATRNNNPGNLMYAGQTGAIGKDSRGFAIFGSPESGNSALQRQIELDASRGLSIREFIGKYAPLSENDTSNYLGFITGGLGVGADTPLASVTGGGNGSGGYVPGFDDSLGIDLDNYLGSYDLSYNSEGPTMTQILLGVGILGVVWYAS